MTLQAALHKALTRAAQVIDTVERLAAFDSTANRRQLELLKKLGAAALTVGEYHDNSSTEQVEWPYANPNPVLDPLP